MEIYPHPADAHPNADGYADTDAHPNADEYADTNADPDADEYADPDAEGYANIDADTNADGYTDPNAHCNAISPLAAPGAQGLWAVGRRGGEGDVNPLAGFEV